MRVNRPSILPVLYKVCPSNSARSEGLPAAVNIWDMFVLIVRPPATIAQKATLLNQASTVSNICFKFLDGASKHCFASQDTCISCEQSDDDREQLDGDSGRSRAAATRPSCLFQASHNAIGNMINEINT